MTNMNYESLNRKDEIQNCKSFIACRELEGRISAVEYREINCNVNSIILSIDIFEYCERLKLCFIPELFLGKKQDYGDKLIDVENYLYGEGEIELLLINNLKNKNNSISSVSLKNIMFEIEEELIGKKVIVYPEVIYDNLIRYFFTINECGEWIWM